MKTLKISDDVHQKLTSMLIELMSQTNKMQTYQDAILAMLNQSVILPPELLGEIQSFIEENKRLGFTTREEFIRDATRWRLKLFKENEEFVEVPRDKYERLETAVKKMSTPYRGAEDFINTQIEEALEKYNSWLEEKEERQKGQRRKRQE
jgi:uncharacterized protein involved in tolerance to divalent cations